MNFSLNYEFVIFVLCMALSKKCCMHLFDVACFEAAKLQLAPPTLAP